MVDVKTTTKDLYEAMDKAKEKIEAYFDNVKPRYQRACNIINNKWELQLRKHLHMAACFLNPK